MRDGEAAVLGFFATHVVVAGGIELAEVRALPDADDLSGRFNPPFLCALCARLGGRRVSAVDAVLVASPLDGPPPLTLREVTGADHPRVVRARRYRDDVRAWVTEDERGLLLLGRGLAGRLETAFEVVPQARRGGLGRTLARSARHLADASVWAQVAPANAPSLRAVLSGGFVPVGAEALLVR